MPLVPRSAHPCSVEIAHFHGRDRSPSRPPGSCSPWLWSPSGRAAGRSTRSSRSASPDGRPGRETGPGAAQTAVDQMRSRRRLIKITVPLPGVSSGISRLLTDNCLARSAWPQRAYTSLCKQGVRGSSPLSSTGQKQNSNSRDGSCSSKVQQPGSHEMPCICPVGPSLSHCGRGHSTQVSHADRSCGPLSRKNAVLAVPVCLPP